MKFRIPLIIALLLFGFSLNAQQDTIKVELKTLKDVPKDKLKKDESGYVYYYDDAQKARVYDYVDVHVDVLVAAARARQKVYNQK